MAAYDLLIKELENNAQTVFASTRSTIYPYAFERAIDPDLVTTGGFQVERAGGILLKPLSHQQMESWDIRVVDALYEVGKELPEYCSSLMIVATL